ncbi:long-chain-fatty-acid--CoA ligase [Pseudonocardia sp. WMMC193]|uniref:long-chain-fatty-acid--CoA ligase n=1 Tax=Pseudonocardia sp. WMMC193 TaxID=2911965 RepID=UPI001F42D279|nr:long-chain-fatty-acid--CoA ligase [Pseudonocardia sp. WMMC193]MCF7549336.1 long-chain-fatty-acid--CoA ligase [Pseudonocardia sp. WMMC193]
MTAGQVLAERGSAARLPGGTQHWLTQIDRHAHLLPDRPALVFEGRTTTWSDLHRRVHALAGALADRGVQPGDRVAVLMSNRTEFVEGLLAANAAGAIAVPVNFRLTADEVTFILQDSGSVALAVDADLAPTAAQVRGALAGPALVLVTGADPAVAGPGALSFDELAESRLGLPAAVAIDERDPALIMYTSGTTGRPKGAVLTHLNLAVQTQTLIRIWRLVDEDEVSLCASPMFHIAAIGAIAPLIAIGGTTVIAPSGAFDPQAMIDTLDREGITHVFMVPSQWQAVVDVPDAGRRAHRLRLLCWGAAPATVPLLRRMAEVFPGVPNVCTFGQTEMSPITTALRGEDAIRKIGSIGRPVPAVDIRIVNDAMQDVARGEVGEIVYRGPGLMQGYWNLPEATTEATTGGWFHSGDLVREDEDGFLYVVDRKKDMIISGGENIYCAEVEDVLAGHPAVLEVAVVGAPHERWGETPVAVVVPAGTPPTLAELTEWCRTRLASYKKPTRLLLLDALPRNATGKVRKPVLRERVR